MDVINFMEDDCCEFSWSDAQGRQNEVRLRVYCDPVAGWPEHADMAVGVSNVEGHREQGQVNFLDPIHLLKGRIRDAAMGFKYEHGTDIYFLATEYDMYIRPRAWQLNLYFLGLALKNHPHLEPLFADLEMDMAEAKRRAEARGSDSIGTRPRDIWRNLLF
ncbi:hypothetical protein F5Y05DRAFT_415070 [Hypoxylon sp. FL0543]|nr:hypothetical protein F5Y05DRAFT_415070 [Hypoxylon sp. FL0543]